MGYQTKEVLAGGKTFITVTLSPLNNSLNEIVVTGYTTQLRKDITGSVASVNVSVANNFLFPILNNYYKDRPKEYMW
jgi:hypothetical protein